MCTYIYIHIHITISCIYIYILHNLPNNVGKLSSQDFTNAADTF